MTKQSKSKSTPAELNVGRGKITPVQIAFLVDKYLGDNGFSSSRSAFRSEASSLLSKSPLREAPKTLLTLSEILNEYIQLKELKVTLDHDKARVLQEKARVDALLRGLQSTMNIYNAAEKGSDASFQHLSNPAVMPSATTNIVPVNFSPVISNPPATKRKGFIVGSEPPPGAKRYRSRSSASKNLKKGEETSKGVSSGSVNNPKSVVPVSAVQLSVESGAPSGSLVQGSSVVKCLFNQPSFSNAAVNANSSVPQTPPRAISSQSDKSVSPVENSAASTSSGVNSPPEISVNCCTIFSSKRVTLTPTKACYTVQTNHCISSSPVKPNSRMSSRREHVKGRLNFDSSDAPVDLDNPVTDEIPAENPINEEVSVYKPITDGILDSTSGKELDIFDMDLPNFDALGVDFNFTEMLGELDLDYGELGFTCQQPSSSAFMENVSGPSYANMDGSDGANHVMSQYSSTVTELISEKGTNAQGPDSMTTMKSVTKCIRIISPVKKKGSSVDQENSIEIN